MIRRTTDYQLVREILTCPDIYSAMGDDFLPPAEEFRVNQDARIWYVIASNPGPVGLFTLLPQNTVCWELHVALISGVAIADKRQAAQQLIPWISEHTPCKRLTAAIPACNKPAIAYGTHFLGMHYVGRQHKAFLKYGILQDLIILGRSVNSDEQ